MRDGRPRRIDDPDTHEPLRILGDGIRALTLSPDGQWIATIRPYPSIPQSWIEKYPTPDAQSIYRLHPGTQDFNLPVNWGVVGQYVVVDRKLGLIRSLTQGPDAYRLGWFEGFLATITWSPDGHYLFIPATYADRPLTVDNRPCSVVVDMRTFARTCMRPQRRNMATSSEEGYARMYAARFVEQSQGQPIVELETDHNRDHQFTKFVQNDNGTWAEGARSSQSSRPLRFAVMQDMNHAPVLVRTGTSLQTLQTVFDPNPQLRETSLGSVEDFAWSDESHHWSGQLYLPLGYQRNARYPVVIQTHGYDDHEFMPSGRFQSAFVAEELAATGVMVLQVQDCPGRGTLSEASCNVSEYETAIQRLSEERGADPSRVGIIGFSRTVLYVMKALESSKLHFKAASINDGLSDSYLSYILNVGGLAIGQQDSENLAGGVPLGEGKAIWLKNSPDFNTEAITTPVRVVSEKGYGMLVMWEPYARLKLGGQPTELVVLNTESHLIAEPIVRRVAQQGNVDWFRFWLQDFVDPDLTKSDQYRRWEIIKSKPERSRRE